MAIGTTTALALGAGAGALGGSLIGGGGGGGSSGGSVQQVQKLLPEQENLLKALIGQILPQLGQPGRVPGDELGPVGPSQLQQQAFNFAGGLPQLLQSEAFQPFDPQDAISAFQPTAQFARQGFQQQTIPAIMAALGAGGAARSSGAANILGREGRNLELGLSAQLGQQQFGAQQAALGRQAQLPSIAGQLGGQLSNIGAIQQSFPAAQRAFNLEQFFAADPFRNPALGLLGSALGTSAFDTAVFQGFKQPGLAESLLPALGQLGGGLLQNPGLFN